MAQTLDSLFGLILKESGILFAGFVLGRGLSFVGRLLIARFLPSGGYGAISIGLTILTIASTMALVGLDTGVSRYLPRDDTDVFKRSVLIASLKFVIPLSLGATAVLFFAAGPLARDVFDAPATKPVIRLFSLAIPFAAIAKLAVGAMRGNQRSLPKVYIQNIALPVSRLGLIAVFFTLGFAATGMAAAYVLSYALAGMVGVYYLVRHTPLLKRLRSVSIRRELLSFSAPLMITAAVSLVFTSLDTLMLGYFSSTRVVGIYNAVYPTAILLTLVQSSVGFVFMPVVSEMHSDGRMTEMRRMYQLAVKWIVIFTVPLFAFLVMFPGEIIRLTFGPKYVTGAVALVVLSTGFLSHTIVGPNGNMLTSLGKTKTMMLDNVAVAVVNFVLNLILIPEYSYVGAAIATTVAYFMLNGLYSYQLYTLNGAHPIQKTVVYPCVGGAVIAVGTYSLSAILPIDGFLLLMVAAIVFAIPYLIVVIVSGGIETEEQELLSVLAERFDPER
ncbi:flippase [Halococcus qingdaonensis]|uniref:flippase n=1 Tax=Halococcus qingdaonensis TaxID=224402 RepID=UPI002116B9A7|nr:flippase [Halococcus qingdaonensis]